MAEWIRYKLDREFDHVLVDEAQDTNEAQWSIIDALTDEFYAGLGQRDDRYRTLFVVGDYKQAIFRFQGTSPENFHAAKERYKAKMDQAADNALQLRSAIRPKRLQEYGLGRSFRSSNTILDFVNRALDTVGFVELPSDYMEPYVVTRRMIEDGRKRLVLRAPLALPFPVRMLQGTQDEAVGRDVALRLLDHAEAEDIRLTFVKGADHRFSDEACLNMIIDRVKEVSNQGIQI